MNAKLLVVLAVTGALAACGGGEKRKNKQSVEEKTTANGYVCKAVGDDEVAAQFTRWNEALKTGDAKTVASLYALDSVLLPTVSDKVRYTPAEKEDYFKHFLEKKPVGEINERAIQIGCNWALDAGIYTFTYQKTGEKATGRYSYTYRWDGKQWQISSHHSSLMPEPLMKAAATAKAAPAPQAAPQPAPQAEHTHAAPQAAPAQPAPAPAPQAEHAAPAAPQPAPQAEPAAPQPAPQAVQATPQTSAH